MARRRVPMPVSQRAKQFMPFAAVTGLEAALREKELEQELTERRELSEECAGDLDRVLAGLGRGEVVRVTFYQDGRYRTLEGAFTEVDGLRQVVTVGETEIPVREISELSRLEGEFEG